MARSGGDIETGAECAIVYIDGLNLHGVALRGRNPAYKWADLRKLAQTVTPGGVRVDSVKYFSADLHQRAAEEPGTLIRQRHYLKALKATGVDVRRGQFVVPIKTRTLSPDHAWSERVIPPMPAELAARLDDLERGASRPWKARVQLPEEKFTDVAIGVELVDDFHRGRCDLAVLITNDGDLRPAVEKRRPHKGTECTSSVQDRP